MFGRLVVAVVVVLVWSVAVMAVTIGVVVVDTVVVGVVAVVDVVVVLVVVAFVFLVVLLFEHDAGFVDYDDLIKHREGNYQRHESCQK